MPEDMGDLCALQVQTAGRFCASQDLPSLKDESTERLNDILDSVGSRLAHGEVDALSEQENFDAVYSLVRSVCVPSWLSSCFGGCVLQGRETHITCSEVMNPFEKRAEEAPREENVDTTNSALRCGNAKANFFVHAACRDAVDLAGLWEFSGLSGLSLDPRDVHAVFS